MLLVLPPSETKAPSPEAGPPVDLEGLSFPELTPLRRRVVAALVATSSHPDAFRRLFVRPSMAADVARNARVLELPARPAAELYTGPLQAGLAALELSDGAAARAMQQVVVASPLWGLVRLHDRIPRYRLHLMAHLVGMESLEPVWRTVLPATLAVAAGPAGVIVDLRSPVYQAMGMPAGLGDRTVVLRVERGRSGRRIGDVIAKRLRGEAARHLLESGADAPNPDALGEVLADRWPVRLEAPERRDGPWTMTLSTTG